MLLPSQMSKSFPAYAVGALDMLSSMELCAAMVQGPNPTAESVSITLPVEISPAEGT
ncbi:hypothetical protein DSECCO2_307040 [anaerobic digester metagenome]